MEEIKQTSTHIGRGKYTTDSLDVWLDDWGKDCNEPVKELSTPMQTSIKTIEIMQTEAFKSYAPQLYYENRGKLKKHKRWYCEYIYALKNMWRKLNQKSTPSSIPKVPSCRYRYNLRLLDRAIGGLPPYCFAVVSMRYRHGYTARTAFKEIGIPEQTFYSRLKKAKKLIKKSLKSIII